jgi:hypothetical protein
VSLNTTICPQCRGALIEIDHHGKRLLGCVKCNRWTRLGSEHRIMQLPKEDLEALNNLSDARHRAEDTSP